MDKYDGLKLENQLCFPLYSVSNLITRNYKPLLDALDLTYTQYIVMMVLWEKERVTEKQLGKQLFLKSNTLTLLLQKLSDKGYVSVAKDESDARYVVITLTETGKKLKDRAVDVPPSIAKTINLSADEAVYLYKILYKILEENKDEKV
ncbi:MAG: MarR family transcriptional regulator [Clostridia bacterium]|nr:MarR family transcriptional regulator [Clostridia bacterium]